MPRSDKEIFDGLSSEAKKLLKDVLELEKKNAQLDLPIKDSADRIYKQVKGYFQ